MGTVKVRLRHLALSLGDYPQVHLGQLKRVH